MLGGATIPNNSIVDIENVLYTDCAGEFPRNGWPAQNDRAVLCVTDLVNCCDRQDFGNWYLPNGSIVPVNTGFGFRSNRGQNEVVDGHHFYGSVRLYRLFSSRLRGRFRCELPDADSVIQTLYANIGKMYQYLYIYSYC